MQNYLPKTHTTLPLQAAPTTINRVGNVPLQTAGKPALAYAPTTSKLPSTMPNKYPATTLTNPVISSVSKYPPLQKQVQKVPVAKAPMVSKVLKMRCDLIRANWHRLYSVSAFFGAHTS